MIKTNKLIYTFLFSIFFTIAALGISDNVAKASAVSFPDYVFKINAQDKADGSEYEMVSSEMTVGVEADGWAAPSSVEWISTEKGVVTLEATQYTNYVKMVRKGPGYSTIIAKITQGGFTYSISILIKVGLEIDYQNTGTIYATTTGTRILKLDTIDQSKQIYLKYADTGAVSGAAISATAVSFQSDNEGVVQVTANGQVTAKSAGSATITITSTTMSSTDKPMKVQLLVVVKPTFSFTYDDDLGVQHICNSKSSNTDASAIYSGVPSNFVIQSNATVDTNLTWVVYNLVGGKRTLVSAGTSDKMTYTISDSGTVSFSKVEAGTYEIYAFTNKNFDEKANAPYAYIKIYVPIDISDLNIIMNVGDTYNILENSNLPDTDVFVDPSNYDFNIAKMDSSNYIITAKKQGKVTITLVYDTGQGLFEGTTVSDIKINITVIDGISLSTAKATLYTKGTLQLEALVTDNTNTITWSSSNTGIATVTDGLVTGVKAGTAVITAKQTINGVVKKATCEITVQQTVTTIVLDPSVTTLAIKGYTTLHATISPNNLSGVTLQWKSSNDNIVKIVETSALTATIQGVAGGHAVISAINQDNVVVGYCDVTVQQPVTSIVLSETAATLDLSLKYIQLRATVYPENAVNKNIIWSTTDSSKATINANGLVTLLKPGTVTIIATSEDNKASVAYCNLTITIPVVSIALDETLKTMYVGQSARLSYVILPTNANNNAVTWISTNTSVVTVDATGKVAAKGVGTSVIILKTSDGGYSAYCTITVKLVATTVKLDVTDLSLKTGESYNIKATLAPVGSTDNSLVWESSDTKVATVDANGKVVAKNAGTAIITVRTEAGGVAYCKVSITQAVKGVILNFTDKTIYKGEKFDLIASVSPSTATKLDVTWKSSNTKVATVTNKGEVAGLIGGVAIITCTTVDGGYITTCVVTVKETVTTVKLDKDTYSLGIKKTVKLTATASTETATNQKVTWSSSNKKVATVNQNGKVTGISVGYATITAAAKDGSDVEATCEIRVVTLVSSIVLNKSTMSMFVGDSKSLKTTIKPSKATYKKARWSSSDESVAIVDEDGTVIAVKAGTVMITAGAQDSSGKKAICYVTVHDRLASTGITLQDKKLTMVSGEYKIVELVLIPSASTDGVTWSTDNPAVATVNKKTGKIVAKSTGIAYISVMTDSGKTATIEVTVIGLNTTRLITEEYTTYKQALSVEGARGNVTWRIDNPLIAVVSSDGTVSTRAVGTTTITATVNGRKLTCKLTVKKMT
ncbi:MAG: Ig-like domain-containing protein [Herbinix sp.]|nr:Ig-like domain-containing protein [Herbinix sp.]